MNAIAQIAGAAIPLSIALAIWPQAAGSQDDDIRRVRYDERPPACVEAPDSALCEVESFLAIRQIEEVELGPFGRAVNWLLDLVFDPYGGNPPPYKFGGPVVKAELVEYRIVSWEDPTADESAPVGHDTTAVIEQRHIDANGFIWPPEGWDRTEISIEKSKFSSDATMIGSTTQVRSVGVRSANSQCIGRLKTPLCAVETWLACHARNNQEFCRVATDSNLSDTEAVPFFVPNQGFSYDVLRMVPVARGDYNASAASDTYEVVLHNNLSPVDSKQTEFIRFVVVKRNGDWRVRDREIILWERDG